ncbi:M-phase phosphoprotein 8-like [Echinops telfairi]|uniref:M-phase phosphoprotein 8-like n=1 Tax=Echinops telfairi TaxID=9371 RepID=A0ABM0ZTG4_ECHTE|nr:M-phase phosphoprotein 8-like [Echinops telfairi]
MAAASAAGGVPAPAAPVPGADGHGESPEDAGGGRGSADEETGAQDSGVTEGYDEDVFEVEKILDMTTEGGKVFYKVRWKGYTSLDDTWEPEVHLENCKEVLLDFRKTIADNKAKPVSWFIQRLSLSNDIFEANSDSDEQNETKEDTSSKKKKQQLRAREEKSLANLRKRRAKAGRLRDRSTADLESSLERIVLDLKRKKRLSEAKELNKSKKDDAQDAQEPKKLRPDEPRDLRTKIRDYSRENRRTRKGQFFTSQWTSGSSVPHDSLPQDDGRENPQPDKEEKPMKSTEETAEPRSISDVVFGKHPDGEGAAEEDPGVRRHAREQNAGPCGEKQHGNQAQGPSPAESERPVLTSAQVHKDPRLGEEESGLRSTGSPGKEQEIKKNAPKEKWQKMHDSDMDGKDKRKPQELKRLKEVRSAFDMLTLTPEEKNDLTETNWKREEISLVCKTTDDHKTEENEFFKESRNAKDETDTWVHAAAAAAAAGHQAVVDSACQTEATSDCKPQKMSLGVDLKLEWMKLEDFQKHLDGEDEDFAITGRVPCNVLRDAVKNGDYITVKGALNSSEEYNLEQEDSSGLTLMMLAAAGGQDDVLRLLIKKGAKVNRRQKNGKTALIHAAEKNFLTTVAILLEAGAFVNVQQSNGETALMKACKRGNWDIVRLVIECGADCNILSKHQNSALYFAKQSKNMLVYDLLKNHLETLSRVAEETIRDYFEARLLLLELVFPIACHRLCEGPDFSTEFNYKPPQNIPEGSGILLFILHANFVGKEVVARLCGPCSVQAVVLNDKFQLPVFLDSHFVYSFSPVAGLNKLFIGLAEVPTAKVKLLIGAYRVQAAVTQGL